MRVLITGGSGFIGSALIRSLIADSPKYNVLNIDSLTYASNESALDSVLGQPNYQFKKIDICNYEDLSQTIKDFLPERIIHLAAESHVDNSINDPFSFLETNILGTYNLLQASRDLISKEKLNKSFVFHHVSTDEVFGDLQINDKSFTEESNYLPSSPYSASKASSDHLVRAWSRTYGLNYVITNCSNNFGPFQHAEKLIPKTIHNAIMEKPIPLYGNGKQIRDWLYVEDHVEAIRLITKKQIKNDTFNIGANNEMTNIEIVSTILNKMIEKFAFPRDILDLISFVKDRPGHDERYGIDPSKIISKLGWKPRHSFNDAIEKTISWYISDSSK